MFVHACVCARVFVYVYACVGVCSYVRGCVCVRACMHACVCVFFGDITGPATAGGLAAFTHAGARPGVLLSVSVEELGPKRLCPSLEREAVCPGGQPFFSRSNCFRARRPNLVGEC